MKNLRKLRLKHSLSQAKLAEQFHMSQQAIHKYESGIAEPDIGRLTDFADFFHVSVDYLIGHAETPDPGEHPESMQESLNHFATDEQYSDRPGEERSIPSVSEEALLAAWQELPKPVQSSFYQLICLYKKN